MNTHKNARLTFARRLEMVQDVTQRSLSQAAAALAQGVSEPTVRKWLGRYLAQGEGALIDRSSRPRLSPRTIAPAKALAIVELRRHRLTQARIATSLGVSKSTVGRVLARAGLSHLKDLEPIPAVLRYEHEAAGDLLHIDTKRLGRIVRPGHRVTGDRRGRLPSVGYGFCLWPSMIMRASALPTCTRIRARRAPFNSCATPWPISSRSGCSSNGF